MASSHAAAGPDGGGVRAQIRLLDARRRRLFEASRRREAEDALQEVRGLVRKETRLLHHGPKLVQYVPSAFGEVLEVVKAGGDAWCAVTSRAMLVWWDGGEGRELLGFATLFGGEEAAAPDVLAACFVGSTAESHRAVSVFVVRADGRACVVRAERDERASGLRRLRMRTETVRSAPDAAEPGRRLRVCTYAGEAAGWVVLAQGADVWGVDANTMERAWSVNVVSDALKHCMTNRRGSVVESTMAAVQSRAGLEVTCAALAGSAPVVWVGTSLGHILRVDMHREPVGVGGGGGGGLAQTQLVAAAMLSRHLQGLRPRSMALAEEAHEEAEAQGRAPASPVMALAGRSGARRGSVSLLRHSSLSPAAPPPLAARRAAGGRKQRAAAAAAARAAAAAAAAADGPAWDVTNEPTAVLGLAAAGGDTLAAACADGSVRLVGVSSRDRRKSRAADAAAEPLAAADDDDGDLGEGLVLLNADRVEGRPSPIRHVALSPDGRSVYSLDGDNLVRRWNMTLHELDGVTHTESLGEVGRVQVVSGGHLLLLGTDHWTEFCLGADGKAAGDEAGAGEAAEPPPLPSSSSSSSSAAAAATATATGEAKGEGKGKEEK